MDANFARSRRPRLDVLYFGISGLRLLGQLVAVTDCVSMIEGLFLGIGARHDSVGRVFCFAIAKM